MDDLDIDGSLPGQELEEEETSEEIRRENELISRKDSSGSENWVENTNDGDSQRGMLYFVAGAGYGLLLVYLIIVLALEEKNLPILSDWVSGGDNALAIAILVSIMFYITIWFFMSGRKHSFFTDDPDKAKFYAGIIGLSSIVFIATFWEDYSNEMLVSAVLTSISTWAYIRSSEMKI